MSDPFGYEEYRRMPNAYDRELAKAGLNETSINELNLRLSRGEPLPPGLRPVILGDMTAPLDEDELPDLRDDFDGGVLHIKRMT